MSQETKEKPKFNKELWIGKVRELEQQSVEGKKHIKDLSRKGKFPPSIPEYLGGIKKDLTLLYSIRAHYRGRLHMRKRKDSYGDHQELWHMDKQEALVDRHMDDYLLGDQEEN